MSVLARKGWQWQQSARPRPRVDRRPARSAHGAPHRPQAEARPRALMRGRARDARAGASEGAPRAIGSQTYTGPGD